MKIYIRAMSEHQSKIYDNLTAASSQIDMHIIKLMLYPNSKYVDHWMHEVWASLFEVDKLKGKNKYPSEKFIRNALAVHNDVLENYVRVVIDLEEGLTPESVNITNLITNIQEYQAWLAHELSLNGVVLQSAVKAKLKELLS